MTGFPTLSYTSTREIPTLSVFSVGFEVEVGS